MGSVATFNFISFLMETPLKNGAPFGLAGTPEKGKPSLKLRITKR